MSLYEDCISDLEKILDQDGLTFVINDQTILNEQNFKDACYPLFHAKDDRKVLFDVRDMRNRIISYFFLTAMPGCCGVCISTGSWVDKKYRGKGVASRLNKFRKDLAKHCGYAVLMCTDVDTNDAQKKVLKKNGWLDIFTFINRRTNNKVNIAVVDL